MSDHAPVRIPIEMPAPAVERSASERIDIPLVAPARETCAPQSDGEIVVCAPNPEANRLHPLAPPGQPGPGRANVKLGEGAEASAALQAGSVGDWPSNRVMVGVKLEF